MLERLKRLFGMFPGPLRSFIKAILAPRYYLRVVVNDLKALMGNVPGETRIIFVAGYPKSGTTWVENFISNIPGYSPRVLGGDRETIRHHELPPGAFDHISGRSYSAIKTHINPSDRNIEVLARSGVGKVLVMYRDPRDVVVSNYYHILKNNPWKPEDPFYVDYAGLEKGEGLTHSLQMTIDDYVEWVRGWKRVAEERRGVDCLFLSYEDLRADPEDSFRKILAFFGIRLSDRAFGEAVAASGEGLRRGLLASSMPGGKSTKRKGAVGEWRHELSDAQKRVLKEKVGALLIELGYEDDLEW